MSDKLIAKYFINGKIIATTGLHIGGSKTSLDIGGIDLNVIKTASGMPFIPGSSLKGKLRTLLAREQGSESISADQEPLPTLFGDPGDKIGRGKPARLIVRDAFLDEQDFGKKRENEFADLEMTYTESKWENTINRRTGTAEHPRQLERVPAGATFNFEIVYNAFNDGNQASHLAAMKKALLLLQDDYLGGQGSRGYGRIEFDQVRLQFKTISDYEDANERRSAINDFLAQSDEELRQQLSHLDSEVAR